MFWARFVFTAAATYCRQCAFEVRTNAFQKCAVVDTEDFQWRLRLGPFQDALNIKIKKEE